MDYHYFLIQLLYLVEYADYNSQAKLGNGNVDSTGVVTSGGCDALGMRSGTLNNDNKHSVIYRGIEDIYGNLWQVLDGINFKDRKTYICYDQSKYAVDTFTGCYKEIGYTNANESGFIKKVGYDAKNPLLSFPIEINGNNATNDYIPDSYVQALGDVIAFIGGSYTNKTRAGLFYLSAAYNSATSTTISGSRLIKIN